MDISVVTVSIIIAVSDTGLVETCPKDDWHVQRRQKAEAFIAEKRADPNVMWTLSIVTVDAPCASIHHIDGGVARHLDPSGHP